MMASVGGCACFLFRYALECVLALVSLALLGISLCFRLYCDVSASNAIPEEDLSLSSSDSSSTATMMTCLSTPPLKALLRVVSLDDSIAEHGVLVGMHVVLTTCFLAQVYHLFCRVVLLFPRGGAKSAVSLRQQTAKQQSHHANRAVLCAVLLLLWHLFLLSWLIAAEVNTELSAWSQYQPCAEVESPPRQAHPSLGGCAVDQSVATTRRGVVHDERAEDKEEEQNDANCIAQRNGEVVWEGTTQRSVLRYQSSLLFDQWPPPLWAYVLETPQCSATRRLQMKDGDDDDKDGDRGQTRKAMFRDDDAAEQTSLSNDFGSWLWGGIRRSDVGVGVVSQSSTVKQTGWEDLPAVQRRDAAVCGIRVAFVVALVTIFQSVALLTLL